MRHPSPQDDCSGLPPWNPSAPRWTYTVGLASPSSGTEVIYDSPEEYEDQDVPALIYDSPETKKRRDAEEKRRDAEF